VDRLAAIASAISGVAAIWAAWAGLRRARREARRLCDEELDSTRARLADVRREAEALAADNHTLRMQGRGP
jgi:hypothetical protein